MSLVPIAPIDPTNPKSIDQRFRSVVEVVNGNIEFGNPQDPTDPTSTTLAGSAAGAHPGTVSNILGSWVELDIDGTPALNAAVVCTHNLGVPLDPSLEPNVRWLLFGWRHNGTGAGTGSPVSVGFTTGDPITEDAISLRVFAATRTVDVTNPLRLTLFFVPAQRFTP